MNEKDPQKRPRYRKDTPQQGRIHELTKADAQVERSHEKKGFDSVLKEGAALVEQDVDATERRVAATPDISPEEEARIALANTQAKAEAEDATRAAKTEIEKRIAELMKRKEASIVADPLRRQLERFARHIGPESSPLARINALSYEITYPHKGGSKFVAADTYHDLLLGLASLSREEQKTILSANPDSGESIKVKVAPTIWQKLSEANRKKFESKRNEVVQNISEFTDEIDPKLSQGIGALQEECRTEKNAQKTADAISAIEEELRRPLTENPLAIEGIESLVNEPPSPEAIPPTAEEVSAQILRGEPVSETMASISDEVRRKIARLVVEGYAARRRELESQRASENLRDQLDVERFDSEGGMQFAPEVPTATQPPKQEAVQFRPITRRKVTTYTV